MKKISVKQMVIISLMVSVTAVLSQIAIPMPTGVPITLQTFAVALCGYMLGVKSATVAMLVYVALGAVGAPVFSGFGGGIGKIIGVTGGFIIGFIFMSMLCGLANGKNNLTVSIMLGIAGIAACHICGIVQFALLTGRGVIDSALIVSVPYLIKDFVSVTAAYFAAKPAVKMLDKHSVHTS